MKKFVVFMVAALFLLGSFPMAFAEGNIMPLGDCDHSCGSDPAGWEESDRGCYSMWVNKYFVGNVAVRHRRM